MKQLILLRRPALLVGATVVAIAALAAPAQATYTSQWSGLTATMTGNSASDQLTIDSSGGNLRQDRFDFGDPNFSSSQDFDTGLVGNQLLAGGISAILTANSGDGNDDLVVGTGSSPAGTTNALIDWDGQAGDNRLTVNNSSDSAGRTQFAHPGSVGLNFPGPAIEYANVSSVVVFNSAFADTINVTGVTTPTTFLAGGGGDAFTVGSGGSIDALDAALVLLGGAGTDSLELDDSANSTQHTYAISDTGLARDGIAPVTVTGDIDTINLRSGAGGSLVAKSSVRAVTISAGAGNDTIFSADGAADNVNCGAGTNVVHADALDTVAANCQTVNRPGSGPGPGTSDTTPPTVTITKLPAKTKISKLIKGLTFSVGTNEATSIEVEARATAKQVKLAAAYNVTLGSARLASGTGTRSVKLKADKRLLRKAKKVNVQVRVTATDAAGNRTTVSRTVKAKR